MQRFREAYERYARAPDPPRALRTMRDVDVIAALSYASQTGDAYTANVLGTEALNRARRRAALLAAVMVGLGVVLVVRFAEVLLYAPTARPLPFQAALAFGGASLVLGGLAAFFAYRRSTRALRPF